MDVGVAWIAFAVTHGDTEYGPGGTLIVSDGKEGWMPLGTFGTCSDDLVGKVFAMCEEANRRYQASRHQSEPAVDPAGS